jgi:hypothetical protein
MSIASSASLRASVGFIDQLEIHYHGQLQPALPDTDAGNVRYPGFARGIDGELVVETVGRDDGGPTNDLAWRLVSP